MYQKHLTTARSKCFELGAKEDLYLRFLRKSDYSKGGKNLIVVCNLRYDAVQRLGMLIVKITLFF